MADLVSLDAGVIIRACMTPRTIFNFGVALDAAILAAGWIPARLMVSAWQRREGLRNLPSHYEYLGVSVPMSLTALAILVCSLITLGLLIHARRFRLLAAYLIYVFVLAVVWGWAFVSISFDAFD